MGGVSGDDGDSIPPSGDLALCDRLSGSRVSGLLCLSRWLGCPSPEEGDEDDGAENTDDRQTEAGGHFATPVRISSARRTARPFT